MGSKKNNLDSKYFESQIHDFKAKFNNFKKITEDRIDTSNFLFETLFLDYELNESRTILNYIQSLSSELLLFLDNICREHDLKWWLDYGTLIGAVRHENFVPWDDDVDIGMMRKDFIEFDNIFTREVRKHGLNDIIEVGYRPRDIGNGKTISTFIQIYVRHKIVLTGNRPILASIDIFPYDFIKKFDKDTISENFLKTKHEYFNHKKNHFNSKFCLEQYYEDLNLTYDCTDFILPGAEGSCGSDEIYNLVVFDTKKIFPLSKIKYGKYVFPCPNDPNYYLRLIYGNYMNIPKSIHRHNRVDWYRYNSDNDEVFTKCLNKLKRVNESFK